MRRAEALKAKPLDVSAWAKMYYKHQQHHIRRRLEAIKQVLEGKTRQDVVDSIGCSRQSLITWIDQYCEGGLEALCQPIESKRKQKLDDQKKHELKRMLLEQRPTDYGIDQELWTANIIIEVMQKRWDIELKDSRVYEILEEMGLSHQKAHRDYVNASPEAQQQFVEVVKKKRSTKSRRALGIL